MLFIFKRNLQQSVGFPSRRGECEHAPLEKHGFGTELALICVLSEPNWPFEFVESGR